MKAKFSKRLLAYIFDIIIVILISSTINMFIPTTKKADKLYKEASELMEKYTDKEITMEKYIESSSTINYNLSKETVITSVVSIVVYIVYFVIYQTKANGITMGKRIMKIKLKSTSKSTLDINQVLLRSMILYGIGVNILNLIFVITMKESVFNTATTIISYVQFMLLTLIILTAAIRKDGRGLHDIILKTEVIEQN